MKVLERLLLENKAWAQGHSQMDPEYFDNMAKGQNPDILWIGCSDSRVPPDEVINTKPGTLFVHRNIANLVYQEDKNVLSVIEYAVKYLKVKYIIVCGHYGCGGVLAAINGIDNPVLQDWTKMIGAVNQETPSAKTADEVVEANVLQQIENLSKLEAVTGAWAEGADLKLVGWVYDLKNGLIKELKTLGAPNK